MIRYFIKGPNKGAKGTINIEGAKNSCLALMASTVLIDGTVTLKNVPLVEDIITMCKLLNALGSSVKISKRNKTLIIDNSRTNKCIVPYQLISTMRGGCLLMGSLLGKNQNKKIKVAQGGGCALGNREINFHLSGFKALGANINLSKGYVNLSTKKGLIGNKYKFPKVTVTGTSNLIMAAVKAKGLTKLYNVSREPEVVDLVNFLNQSGANIKFKGQRKIHIQGVKKLYGEHYKIIPDRIEAFSYLCVGAITKGSVKVKNINPNFLKSEIKILKKIGYTLKIQNSTIGISTKKKLKAVQINTGPWPKFATDNMPPLLAVLTLIPGISRIKENVFGAHRFQCVPELKRMGAKIEIIGNQAKVYGCKSLSSAECMSSDLRTTFSIILGLIMAEGDGYVSRVYHASRGYFDLLNKLKKLGINIKSQSV